MIAVDAVRLSVGTLTRLPVPPPTSLGRAVAATAMLVAPVVGAGLGLAVGLAAQLAADHTAIGPPVAATLAVGLLAYLTRAIHLDGLADTADALGSGRPAADALGIARRSDIGPFGVVTLVVVLLIQVTTIASAVDTGRAPVVLAVAFGTGRLALALACLRSVPAARTDGLGSAVAGSVAPVPFVAVAGGWLLASVVATGWPAVAAVLGALAVSGVVVRTAIRRLGGITGDVLGAAVESGSTAALVILVTVGP